MSIDFKKELNKAQYEAVSYIDGASLVIAGAGSGKTRVLTYKIAYLLENEYYPSEILALTFTNKAAREMKERIANMLGKDRVRYLQMGTFHSVFLRILRTEAQHIGFDSNFTIYDTSDSLSLIRNIIKEKGLDDKKYKPQSVLSRISNIKNYLITPKMYAEDSEAMKADRISNMQSLHSIYEEYARRCKQSMAMDFDDILLYTHKLLSENKDILDKYQQRFRYILVDEYQDTNYAQHIIVKLFASKHRNICVVGDDAQSIYSFRGANISNIINFQKTYNGARIFKLEQNYRSTKNIVAAANSLIEKNGNQIRKQVYSENELGNRVSLHNSYNDIEEAIYVARRVQRLHQQEGYSYSDMAILYRANSQSRL
ncbi:MAG: UvrD-helicase domain-containing protein, partial [Bacteroides sp.]|nr:UvrD-helicase domain-containing protein [Bacteroides sp.]